MSPIGPRPLAGRSVVVTRAAEQASALRDRLAALGATTVDLPTIVIEREDVDFAARFPGVDWLVVTSPNGAGQVGPALAGMAHVSMRIAVVGPATADALAQYGATVDLMPERHLGEGLVEAFPEGEGRVLVVQAAGARDVVAEGIRDKGWRVEIATAYRTLPAVPPPEQLRAAREADAITFTSSSTVTNFVAAAGPDGVPGVVVCIGPVTAATATELGITVDRIAEPHTVDGLVEAVVRSLPAMDGNQAGLR